MPAQHDIIRFFLELDVAWLAGLAVFVLIAVIGYLLFSRKKPRARQRHPAAPLIYGYGRTPPSTAPAPSPRGTSAEDRTAPPDSFKRGGSGAVRLAVRRTGAVVKVVIADAQMEEIEQGWVVDRSTGGLGIHLETPLAAGTLLNVRPWNARDIAPWVQVVVRNCQQENDHWKVGCQFVKTPPWGVLLMFG